LLTVLRSLLLVLLPVILVGLSAAALSVQAVRQIMLSRRARGYQPLSTRQDALGVGIEDEDTDDDDEFAEHLSLRRSISRTTADFQLKQDKPRTERAAVIVELLCIVGIIGVQVAELVATPETRNWRTVVPIVTWGYTLGLAAVRLAYSQQENAKFASLWGHTALIYLFSCIFIVVPFRSVLIHPDSRLSELLMILRFALISVLCLITISVRKGNSMVTQEIVNGLEPSREPVASLISLASFSWVDDIVWKGYWKPFVLTDIWNLRSDDIAASVLTSFRQTK
jgi:hypothetical protein